METGDRKLNEVKKVTDMAYVPVIMADGSIGQIAKSDLASVVAGVVKNSKWENLESISLSGSNEAYVVVKDFFESEFNKSANFSLITGGTSNGAEAGFAMFKHTSSFTCYGIMFNKYKGVLCIKRETNGTWFVKEVLSV